MATLKFADSHNMVAFLSKPAKCKGFEQIVDFLNAHTIKYALTVNPTIYTSCIEQFKATAKAKIINEEVQLQALVDGKKPSGLTTNVADEAVYVKMDNSLERAATTATSLDSEQDRGNINRTQSKEKLNEPSSIGTSSGSGPRNQDTMGDTIAQTRFENVSKTSNDSLLAGVNTPRIDKDSLKLKELMALYSDVGKVNAASIATTVSAAATITTEEITLAQALVEIKTSKPKAKGISFKDPKPVKPKKKVQIMLDEEAAKKLQADKGARGLAIEEKATLFQQLLEKRRKHFAAKRVEDKRNRPLIKAQQRSIMCSLKRTGYELEQEVTKKKKLDDDQEAAKMKEPMEIIPNEEEVAFDAIPLATKPPSIVNWKILKEGKISYFQIIRANGSSKRYSAFIQMLKSFDKEDLETLWKMVKAKDRSTSPEEGYERVLWGDLKTMFEPHVEDTV
ncbi:hypothetical protein Tco_0294201 [Tanacetum coccineum]